MKKPIKLIIIFLSFIVTFSNIQLNAKTIVFPFKVNASENRAYQWMGRGLSLYITLGLQQNSVETASDMESISLLKLLNIKFPYNVSKASILRAAKELEADRVIWGEITTSQGPEGKKIINYRSFIIDMKNFQQKYFPVLKGNIHDLFRIERELLRDIVRFIKGPDEGIVFPGIESDHRNYEMLIKGLLIEDTTKRISFLEELKAGSGGGSDFLNFELARAYFLQNNFRKIKELLNSIDNESYLAGEKHFMEGVLHYQDNEIDLSLKSFQKAVNCSYCSSRVNNNLGLIYGVKNNYKKALEILDRSLRLGRSIEAFINSINISFLLKDESRVEYYMKKGLRYYPENEELSDLLPYFIDRSDNRYILRNIFGKYTKLSSAKIDERKIYFKLINPFNRTELKYNLPIPEPEDKDNETDEFSAPEKKIKENPFDSEAHFELSKLYFGTGELISAGHYAISALFLEKSAKNYLNLLNIYRSQKRAVELSKLLKEAINNFPDNNELKNFSETEE
ncbi:MAG: hypothetical protein ABFR75_02910 [Acidobacteriota bacterium]